MCPSYVKTLNIMRARMSVNFKCEFQSSSCAIDDDDGGGGMYGE